MSRVLPWLLVAVLVAFGRPAAASSPGTPDAYGDFVREYTHRSQAPGGGFETRFDYAALRDAEDGPDLRARLRSGFLSVQPSGMDAAARTAWAVNAYNFLVIDLITENLVSAAGDTLRSIADLGGGNAAVFREKRFTVGDKRYSLDTFERRFVFLDADTTGGPKPPGFDPRLHFVLVCGAAGCPPLLAVPSDPKAFQAHLDLMVRNTLRNPGFLHMEPGDPPRIRVSRIFQWYESDFGGKAGVRDFIATYAPPSVAARVREESVTVEPVLEWDWRLNRP